MGISRELEIIMRRPGGLVLLLAFIGYSKCQVSIEGDCRYACDQDGSCKTDWNGSFRPGGTSASCFSPQFGGSCFGKVDGCKDCNQVCVGGRSSSSGSRPCRAEDVPLEDCERQKTCRCNTECFPGQGCAKQCVGISVEQLNNNSGGLRDCEIKGLCTCQITSRGKECVGIPQENFPSGGSSSSGGSKSDANCRYQCQSNGGCQVFSSSGSGSCFSQAFGGSCSGTPRGCQDCNKAINC